MSNVVAKLNTAKPVEDRHPFIGVKANGQGSHEFMILKYFTFQSTRHGEAIGCELLTLKSDVHEVGTVVFSGNFINRAPNFPGDNQETDRAIDFLTKLVGGTIEDGKATAAAVLGDPRVMAAQPLRGMRIACESRRGYSKKKKNADGTPAEYIDRSWTHIAQTKEEIAQNRAQLDASMPLAPEREAAAPAVPVQAPPPVAAPAAAYPTAPTPTAPAGSILAGILGK